MLALAVHHAARPAHTSRHPCTNASGSAAQGAASPVLPAMVFRRRRRGCVGAACSQAPLSSSAARTGPHCWGRSWSRHRSSCRPATRNPSTRSCAATAATAARPASGEQSGGRGGVLGREIAAAAQGHGCQRVGVAVGSGGERGPISIAGIINNIITPLFTTRLPRSVAYTLAASGTYWPATASAAQTTPPCLSSSAVAIGFSPQISGISTRPRAGATS